MVKVLTAVLTDGLVAVEAACAEALAAGVARADVILNALARRQQPEPTTPIATPERLELSCPPRADCARYDSLRAPVLPPPILPAPHLPVLACDCGLSAGGVAL